jgi:cation diffusion facilitator family transporter
MDKQKAALSSVVGGGLLTALKIFVGLITGSLGILSEALHSGLDFAAALIAFFAVRISDKPPDRTHHYGHSKVESLSALAETTLLLLTSAWVIQEAIARLRGKEAHLEVTGYSIAVMVFSIIVASFLSIILTRTARKHQSQALQADALHYTSDIFSSLVVLLGLIAAKFGMEWADPVAALVVAIMVMVAGIRLSREALNILMDRAPEGLKEEITERVALVPGVLKVNKVRARNAGRQVFVDIEVGIKRSASLEESHRIAQAVEEAILSFIPQGDVIVHTEPVANQDETFYEKTQAIASQFGMRAHSLSFHKQGNRGILEVHLEAPAHWTLDQAHEVVSKLEEKLTKELGTDIDIVTHIEPQMENEASPQALPRATRRALEKVIAEIGGEGVHNVQIHKHGQNYHISLHLAIEPTKSVEEAHKLAEELEKKIREQIPSASRIVIHTEPQRRGES